MRMMMTVSIPVDAGNRAIKDGTLEKTIGRFLETFRPESAYFFTRNGHRCGQFVFDMKDAAQMPALAEPFFTNLGAGIEYCPVMNPEDLKRGLGDLMKTAG